MGTNYPGALDTTTNLPTNRTDSTTSATNHEQDHDNANAAIVAIETVIGTSPAGGYADVKTRLAAAIYNGAGVQTIQPSSDVVALVVKGFLSGTAFLQQWQLSTASVVAFVDHAGGFSAQTLSVQGTLLNSSHLSDSATLFKKSGGTLTGLIILASAGVQFNDGSTLTTAPVSGVSAVSGPGFLYLGDTFTITAPHAGTYLLEFGGVVLDQSSAGHIMGLTTGSGGLCGIGSYTDCGSGTAVVPGVVLTNGQVITITASSISGINAGTDRVIGSWAKLTRTS